MVDMSPTYSVNLIKIPLFVPVGHDIIENQWNPRFSFPAQRTSSLYQSLTAFQMMNLTPYRPWASPTPLWGFWETTFFGNLTHRAVEIRLSAKMPILVETVRALFQNGRPNPIKWCIYLHIYKYPHMILSSRSAYPLATHVKEWAQLANA